MPAKTKTRQTDEATEPEQTDTGQPTDAEQAAEGQTEATDGQAEAKPQITTDMIESFTVAPVESRDMLKPVNARNESQQAMDKIAARAYANWTEAGRPKLWQKMPVITYFLTPEQVPPMRTLIRRACDFVDATGEATGVRVRFGKEFVLNEQQAEKIGQPDKAGKTVLAWAAIDKRIPKKDATSATSNARTDDSDSDES